MFCHKCGNKALEDADFCQKCGTKLIVDETVPPIDSDSVITKTVVQEPDKPEPIKVPEEPLSAVEPKSAERAPPQTPVMSAPTVVRESNVQPGFKEYVDAHVNANTKFSTADGLLANGTPFAFIWKCLGAAALIWLLLSLRGIISDGSINSRLDDFFDFTMTSDLRLIHLAHHTGGVPYQPPTMPEFNLSRPDTQRNSVLLQTAV